MTTDTLMTERGDLPDYAEVAEDLCVQALEADATPDEMRAVVWAVAACAETAQVAIVAPDATTMRGLRRLAERRLLAFRDCGHGTVEVQLIPPGSWYWETPKYAPASTTRERDLYDASGELGLLLLEARAGVPHQPQTVRAALVSADAARLRSARTHGWSYGAMADDDANDAR
jgi:hypothetical protein